MVKSILPIPPRPKAGDTKPVRRSKAHIILSTVDFAIKLTIAGCIGLTLGIIIPVLYYKHFGGF